jgi:hypothetical protein
VIEVPESLKTEIAKLRGRRLYARCRIDYTNSNLDNTIVAVSSSTNPRTRIGQVFNGKTTVSKRWYDPAYDPDIDEPRYPFPTTEKEFEENEVGWWGTGFANPDGTFQANSGKLFGEKLFGEELFEETVNHPGIVVVFSKRSQESIDVYFDDKRMEYAIDFDVDFINCEMTVMHTLEVRGNTGTQYNVSVPLQSNVCQLRLRILKWSAPGKCAKVSEFYTSISELYEGDDIYSLRVTENRELSDGDTAFGSTASGSCEITLFNRDRKFDYDNTLSKLYNVLKKGNRIIPEIGDGTNWIPLGVFYSIDWEIDKRSLEVIVTGYDRMSLLEDTEYSSTTIVAAPTNQEFTFTSDADWNSGTLDGVEVASGSIRLVTE